MAPKVLVDINRVSGLDAVRRENGTVVFGPLVRHAQLQRADWLQSTVPLMHDAACAIGDPQVRNWGTLAGALAEADPCGDWATVALALDLQLTAESSAGKRSIAASEFFLDAYTTALEPNELLTEVRLASPPPGSGGAYSKFVRRTGDFAVASAAVQLTLDQDGVCRSIGIGLGGAGTTPLKPAAAESVLLGTRLEEAAVSEACEQIDKVADPVSDVRGPAEYRHALLKTLFRRALDKAVRRQRGQE
jgi:carbon-monoxide dehydrogenase medium subunit